MKVRLKPDETAYIGNYVEFQFHEGPIKTHVSVIPYSRLGQFQFHEGPIKTRLHLAK